MTYVKLGFLLLYNFATKRFEGISHCTKKLSFPSRISCDQISKKLRIWSYLMENLIFWAVSFNANSDSTLGIPFSIMSNLSLNKIKQNKTKEFTKICYLKRTFWGWSNSSVSKHDLQFIKIIDLSWQTTGTIYIVEITLINPLLRNVVQWSDTLLKSCSICCKIFEVCLTILRHCEVKD